MKSARFGTPRLPLANRSVCDAIGDEPRLAIGQPEMALFVSPSAAPAVVIVSAKAPHIIAVGINSPFRNTATVAERAGDDWNQKAGCAVDF